MRLGAHGDPPLARDGRYAVSAEREIRAVRFPLDLAVRAGVVVTAPEIPGDVQLCVVGHREIEEGRAGTVQTLEGDETTGEVHDGILSQSQIHGSVLVAGRSKLVGIRDCRAGDSSGILFGR